ncbi:MAG: FecR domain-containing protein [Candidatus Marinimicrobia bacterium]|nr:FecR domain-containing protein [Candidatus Neomarinimicrobiota bacterium]
MNKSKFYFPKILFGLLILTCLLTGADQVAVVTKVSGNVNHSQSKKSASLKPGTVIENGDKIRTGSNGFVALIFIDDKSTLKIKSNTELEIIGIREKSSIAKKINMDRGTLRAKVTKQAKSDFVVETPTSVASVKGTDFWLISDPLKGDRLIGLEGIVAFTNIISGMTIDVTGGFMGNSLVDGSLDLDVTNPDIVPSDPEEDAPGSDSSELRIQFQGPDNTTKTLIIEYQ